jgi:endonuclease YncB( thermonuclease family)
MLRTHLPRGAAPAPAGSPVPLRRRAPRPRTGFLAAKAVLGLALLALLAPGPARAHPGPLDQYGGHFDERTGLYHYHHPAKDMALRKPEFLDWVHYPNTGILKGEVVKVDGSDTVWVHMDYRPAYQDIGQHIAVGNKDERNMNLRVDLAHVSPQETGAQNPRFEEWFRNKVEYELKQKLLGHKVTVNFEVVGGEASRLRGMVFEDQDAKHETKDNVNLWLVLNGWSYYVLNDGDNPYDKLFRNAEDIARRNKAGIWAHQP